LSILLESIDSRGSFRLLRDGAEQFQLQYQNWFSSKAETDFNDQQIMMKSKNIWMSKFDIFKDGVDVGDVLDELLIYCGFAANLHMTNSGMG